MLNREDMLFVSDASDILRPLCAKHRWHEKDALDLFFGNGFHLRIGSDDPVRIRSDIESAGAGLGSIPEPNADGGSFGDGIDGVLAALVDFREKYGIPLEDSYRIFRDTREFDSLIRLAVIDSHYHAVVLPGEIENRLCKALRIRQARA